MPVDNALATFVSDFKPGKLPASSDGDELYLIEGKWIIMISPPWKDFTREIVEANEEYPEGAVSIRGDIDFYHVAILPYHFKDIPVIDIVETLWPNLSDPVIYPDHGDHYWVALDDQSLEIPGEPFELWVTYPLQDPNKMEDHRLQSFAKQEQLDHVMTCLEKLVRKIEVSNAEYYGMLWHQGTRTRYPDASVQ